jgi:hypothetical protein
MGSKRPWMVWMALLLGILILAAAPLATAADPAAVGQEQAPDEFGGSGEFDNFEGDDPFDTVDTTVPEDLEPLAVPGPFLIGGYVKLDSEYAFEKADERLSKLSPQLFLEAEYKLNDAFKAKVSGKGFYDLSDTIEATDSHNGSAQDDDEYGIELKDAYLDGRLTDRLSMRIGRQIVAWGDSDYARITDVINPRDLTSPGLIDLEDARLPVAAARITYDFNPWVVEAVTVHEHPGSRISGKGGDFDYYKVLRSPLIHVSDKDTPNVNLENTGIAAKATFSFNGGDLSLVAASTFDDTPVLRYDGLSGGVMYFTPEYDRFTTLGASTTLARGSFLYKLESALQMDRQMMRNDTLAQIGAGVPQPQVRTTSSEDRVTALAGIEYTGIADLRISFETQVIHTLNYTNNLSADENEFATYFQATRDFFNDTLELDLFWVTLHPGNGNILRLSGTYDLTDDWEIQAGIAFYEADSATTDLHPYKDQDRLFFRIRYSF